MLTLADMAGIAPQRWNELTFQPHPSAFRLDISTNASAIWLALKKDETPPDAVVLEQPCRLLIWRRDVTPAFRELTAKKR